MMKRLVLPVLIAILLLATACQPIQAVFTRSGDNAYLGSFQVGSSGAIDGVEESDGAHVAHVALGATFPHGLLVVQDGANEPAHLVDDAGEQVNVSTNFKFVAWEAVATTFTPPLLVNSTTE